MLDYVQAKVYRLQHRLLHRDLHLWRTRRFWRSFPPSTTPSSSRMSWNFTVQQINRSFEQIAQWCTQPPVRSRYVLDIDISYLAPHF
jgi:hypothetical protein